MFSVRVQIDQLMPYYVVDVMKSVPGLAGLFVAGIFSASLSTISASCNALAAVTLEDYASRYTSFFACLPSNYTVFIAYYLYYIVGTTKFINYN